MKWNDRITLIERSEDSEDDVRTTVFADKKSVGYSEFYSASMAGYRASLKFDVYTAEYSGQEIVEYPVGSGKLYKVIRTYLHGSERVKSHDAKSFDSGEYTELTVSEKLGVM